MLKKGVKKREKSELMLVSRAHGFHWVVSRSYDICSYSFEKQVSGSFRSLHKQLRQLDNEYRLSTIISLFHLTIFRDKYWNKLLCKVNRQSL